jgi:hypothetical protein
VTDGHLARGLPGVRAYNEEMARSSVTPNGAALEDAHTSRAQALADAEGLLRAENLEMSAEHQALAARWVAGEVDGAQLEQLGLELVRQRQAGAAPR